MAELRCNTCKYHDSGFCVKLKEGLPHALAKLFYGGAVSLYSGVVTYSGECGIENEQEHEADLEVGIFFPEIASREMPENATQSV
jgi:hypothetical protein